MMILIWLNAALRFWWLSLLAKSSCEFPASREQPHNVNIGKTTSGKTTTLWKVLITNKADIQSGENGLIPSE